MITPTLYPILFLLVIGILLALLKPYVEPALFNAAVALTIITIVLWLAGTLFGRPRLFSLDLIPTTMPTSLEYTLTSARQVNSAVCYFYNTCYPSLFSAKLLT